MHIVYCWEMGEGLGHLMPMYHIINAMLRQGNTVTCILKDISSGYKMIRPAGVNWFSCPRVSAVTRCERPINHADVLHNVGYDCYDNLISLVEAWINLFSVIRPDIVICEYAPTARLVAKIMQIPATNIDSGFSMPPLPQDKNTPLPPIRISNSINKNDLIQSERRTLSVINSVLMEKHTSPKQYFSELFDGSVWYRNWPEFNHFGPHSPERHLGQILQAGLGAMPIWPAGPGKKIFAYLKPHHPGAAEIIMSAAACGYRVLAYLPGFDAATLQKISSSGRVALATSPIDLSKFPDDVEAGIWHSPTGAVARCLQFGMKMIFLPTNLEQYLACGAVHNSVGGCYVAMKSENWKHVIDALQFQVRKPVCASIFVAADPEVFASKLIKQN